MLITLRAQRVKTATRMHDLEIIGNSPVSNLKLPLNTNITE